MTYENYGAELAENEACPASEKAGVWPKVQKILGLIAGCAAMLGALAALVFVFFMGVSVSAEGAESLSFEIGLPNATYEYFGSYYKEWKALDFSDAGYSEWFRELIGRDMLLFGILGTVLVALSMLSVVAFATVATVVFVRNWLGYTQAKADKWALASVLCFVFGAVVFCAIHNISVVMDTIQIVEGESVLVRNEVSVALNEATVAGFVLCLSLAGVSFICKMVASGKTWVRKNEALKYTLVALGLGLVVAGICFAGDIGFSLEYFMGTTKIGVKMAPMYANIAFSGTFAGELDKTQEIYREATKLLEMMDLYNLIAQLGTLTLFVALGGTVYTYVRRLTGESSSTGVEWAGVAFGAAVVALVFTLLAWNNFDELQTLIEGAGWRESMQAAENPISAVGAVVFTGVNLLLAIVHLIVRRAETAVAAPAPVAPAFVEE